MSGLSFLISSKIPYLLKLKNVSSTQQLSPFWALLSLLIKSLWNPLRPQQCLSGLLQLIASSSKDFWALPTFTVGLSAITVRWGPPSMHSPHLKYIQYNQAEKAFTRLKSLFTTAPVLHTHDPEKQFILRVEARGS
ncbi:hypothetical protein CHARACLAT_004194 [Characodon lateralis]|uniref:Uncharacterized protein n=1 Tax=Characodon lateralis TaxID=208331 RepID=A0ABU7EQS9_9TELE|nr:hypothetical protein [Characodon lateralis]